MKPEKGASLFDLIREFNRQKIRYLVIGRRAVILYGGPVLTADNDLWIHPSDKKKTLTLLQEEFGFELSHPPQEDQKTECGAPRVKPMAPYLTPQWGDIPAKRWRIHPRPKAVAFCCRGKR